MIRRQVGRLADLVADRFTTEVWAAAANAGRTDELTPLLRRDRLLLIQAAASLLTDELGRALLAASVTAPAGERLRAALEEVRVGATANPAGRAERPRSWTGRTPRLFYLLGDPLGIDRPVKQSN